MTPKEALEIFEKRIKIGTLSRDYGHTVDDVLHIDDSYEIDTIEKALNELEALKKPPTADEVCKALSEQLKQKVSYGAKQFYYTIENTECIMFVTETYGDGLWSINEYLPPHLITLIGRFYEGLK